MLLVCIVTDTVSTTVSTATGTNIIPTATVSANIATSTIIDMTNITGTDTPAIATTDTVSTTYTSIMYSTIAATTAGFAASKLTSSDTTVSTTIVTMYGNPSIIAVSKSPTFSSVSSNSSDNFNVGVIVAVVVSEPVYIEMMGKNEEPHCMEISECVHSTEQAEAIDNPAYFIPSKVKIQVNPAYSVPTDTKK